MMATVHEPAVYLLKVYHGENLQLHLTYYNPDASGNPDYSSPVDLTGCNAGLKIWRPDTDAILLDVDSATSPNIVLGGAGGTIDVDIPSTAIDAIVITKDAGIPEYRWSFRVSWADGTKDIWMYGPCLVIESWVPGV
jgi:hypothetical protein